MADPYNVPNVGTRPHLYRVLRDTMYHSAGTVLCMMDDQADPQTYERVRIESDDAEEVARLLKAMDGWSAQMDALSAKLAEIANRFDPINARNDALEKMVDDFRAEVQSLTARLKDLEEPKPMEPPPVPAPKQAQEPDKPKSD